MSAKPFFDQEIYQQNLERISFVSCHKGTKKYLDMGKLNEEFCRDLIKFFMYRLAALYS